MRVSQRPRLILTILNRKKKFIAANTVRSRIDLRIAYGII